jgi:hypothetical protein
VIDEFDWRVRLEIPAETFAVHENPRTSAKQSRVGVDFRSAAVIVDRAIDHCRVRHNLLDPRARWGMLYDDRDIAFRCIPRLK